ncbi:uncharacterized protein LOC125065390 [Vanessa atalanta]|uniref:uncharacterized protein LOC125065390 n=1 Tax=Vanessa atalanta TaxID=42275 RepID=UPI001FCE0E3C|nr:uncharacterized protein LOC125065390 [Vanessa atalanta]
MEIRILYYYICISSVLTPYLDAKPFSLNDVIAAEKATQPPENIFKSHNIPQGKKISSLKYKKTFQIKSPTNPKKLKHLQRPRNKRKKLTSKREIHQDEKHTKYIPLLRNIGMLFDNILSSGSSETYDTRKYKYKRNQFITEDSGERPCTCISKHDSENRSDPKEKTFPAPSTTEVENETSSSVIITTTPTYNFANDNINRIRHNKNISSILTRDSSGFWRNNTRFRKRSGPSYNGSFEGHITGVRRNNEYLAIDGQGELDIQHDEENSNSHSRNNTSSHRSSGGIRRIRTDPRNSKIYRGTDKAKKTVLSANETIEDDSRNIPKYERNTEFEIRRNETESAIFLPEFTSRLREYNTEEKNTSIRVAESTEKIFDYSSNKRVIGRNGSYTEENKENRRTDKAITPYSSSNSTFPFGKVVMIFDGYSVARDVNGENKRKEKVIHIHS